MSSEELPEERASDTGIPVPSPQEFLDKGLPEYVQRMFMSVQQSDGDPFLEKLTDSQVDKLIDGEHEDQKRGHHFRLATLIVVPTFVLVCACFFSHSTSLT